MVSTRVCKRKRNSDSVDFEEFNNGEISVEEEQIIDAISALRSALSETFTGKSDTESLGSQNVTRSLKLKIKKIQEEVNIARSDCDAYKQQVQEKDTELSAIKVRRIEKKDAQLTQLKERIDQLETERRHVATAKAVAQLESLNSTDELHVQIQRLHSEIARLQVSLASSKSCYDKFILSYQSTLELNKRLVEENGNLHAQVQDMQKQTGDLKADLELQRCKVKRLEAVLEINQENGSSTSASLVSRGIGPPDNWPAKSAEHSDHCTLISPGHGTSSVQESYGTSVAPLQVHSEDHHTPAFSVVTATAIGSSSVDSNSSSAHNLPATCNFTSTDPTTGVQTDWYMDDNSTFSPQPPTSSATACAEEISHEAQAQEAVTPASFGKKRAFTKFLVSTAPYRVNFLAMRTVVDNAGDVQSFLSLHHGMEFIVEYATVERAKSAWSSLAGAQVGKKGVIKCHKLRWGENNIKLVPKRTVLVECSSRTDLVYLSAQKLCGKVSYFCYAYEGATEEYIVEFRKKTAADKALKHPSKTAVDKCTFNVKPYTAGGTDTLTPVIRAKKARVCVHCLGGGRQRIMHTHDSINCRHKPQIDAYNNNNDYEDDITAAVVDDVAAAEVEPHCFSGDEQGGSVDGGSDYQSDANASSGEECWSE